MTVNSIMYATGLNSASSALGAVFPYCVSRRSCCSSSRTLVSYYNWQRRNRTSATIMPMHKLSSSSFATSSTTDAAGGVSDLDAAAVAELGVEAEKTKPNPQPWLIVGLGNPGKKYDGTRHNVGFEMVDAIANAEGISMKSASFKTLFGKGFVGNVPVLLAKPQTFMNASGESVKGLVSYYKIPLKQMLLIYDDLDLPFTKLRLLPKGGHGGHNGMRSVIDHFKGSRDFPRLRIGIGRPPGKMDPINFVLRSFNKQEREELDFMFQKGSEAVRILLLEGFNKSATFVNSSIQSMERLG